MFLCSIGNRFGGDTDPPRLIVGLLEVDCWFANYLSTHPIIRPEYVSIVAPCEDGLFQAKSPIKWMQQPAYEARLYMSFVTFRTMHDSHMCWDYPALQSILYLTQLRLQDANHRMNTLETQEQQDNRLEPWRVWVGEARSVNLVHLTVNLFSTSSNVMRNSSINCVVLWHSNCLSLTANSHLFEVALGRQSASSIFPAMEEIAAWTRLPAARRACLHAGELYHLLMHRRVSDTVNLHTALTLFKAAVTLGMYVLTQSQLHPMSTGQPLELLGHFDWAAIGDAGLGGESNPERNALQFNHGGSREAVNFIQNGGDFSINGDVFSAGYASARRGLLHFADLMEGTGKWKSQKFCHILHIISEDLMEVEATDEED